jgi:hypothetical protein
LILEVRRCACESDRAEIVAFVFGALCRTP